MSLLGTIVLLIGVLVGATVQGAAGYGFAFVVVPTMALVAPASLPAGPILIAFPLVLWMAFREREGLDRTGIAYIFVGRVPATLVAAFIVAISSTRTILLSAGALILVTSVLSWRIPPVRVTRRMQMLAGFASGLTGTLAATGGPPLAFAYRGSNLRQLRSTLALVYVFGSMLSVLGLAAARAVRWSDAWLALLCVPVLWLGVTFGRRIGRIVEERTWTRLVLTCLASASGIGVVVRALFM